MCRSDKTMYVVSLLSKETKKPLDYWAIGLLDYWIIGLLDYWITVSIHAHTSQSQIYFL